MSEYDKIKWVYTLTKEEAEAVAKNITKIKPEHLNKKTKRGNPVKPRDCYRQILGRILKQYTNLNDYLRNIYDNNRQLLLDLDKNQIEEIRTKDHSQDTPIKIDTATIIDDEEYKLISQDDSEIVETSGEKLDNNPSAESSKADDHTITHTPSSVASQGKTTSIKTQDSSSQTAEMDSEAVKMIPNIEITPSKFSGDEDANVFEFLREVEACKKVNKWSDETTVKQFAKSLSGRALKYLTEEILNPDIEENPSWDRLKKSFQEKFTKQSSTLQQKLLSAVQKENESPTEFARRVIDLCKQVDQQMSEKLKIEYVIRGLKDEHIDKIAVLDNSSIAKLEENLNKIEYVSELQKNKKNDATSKIDRLIESIGKLNLEKKESSATTVNNTSEEKYKNTTQRQDLENTRNTSWYNHNQRRFNTPSYYQYNQPWPHRSPIPQYTQYPQPPRSWAPRYVQYPQSRFYPSTFIRSRYPPSLMNIDTRNFTSKVGRNFPQRRPTETNRRYYEKNSLFQRRGEKRDAEGNSKYCTYCKTTTHTTSQCRSKPSLTKND